MKFTIFVLIILLLLPLSTALSQDSEPSLEDLTYSQAVDVGDLSFEIDRASAILSPDGRTIASIVRGSVGELCFYELDTESSDCQSLPEDGRLNVGTMRWSPDSQYIALVQNFFQQFREPDIWVYDLQNTRFINRTDDNIARYEFGEIGEGDSTGPLWLDGTFTWGADGNIYFVRWELADVSDDLDDALTGIYRIAPTEGEPEPLHDLTGQFAPISTFARENIALDGAISVSPNGEKIVIVVQERDVDSQNNGIWLLSEQAPRQIATSDDFRQGLSADQVDELAPFSLIPYALAWNADGTGIYTLAESTFLTITPYALAYYIDLTSDEVTPLVDISEFTEQDLTTASEETGQTASFQMATSAVLAPNDAGLLILNTDIRSQSIGISLLRADGQQTLIYQQDDYGPTRNLIATIAHDGTVLMWGYLFMPSE